MHIPEGSLRYSQNIAPEHVRGEKFRQQSAGPD